VEKPNVEDKEADKDWGKKKTFREKHSVDEELNKSKSICIWNPCRNRGGIWRNIRINN
jgi:hypothetical protein